MIRLALAQALIPEATITIRGEAGRFQPTPDHAQLGRVILFGLVLANLLGAALALGH